MDAITINYESVGLLFTNHDSYLKHKNLSINEALFKKRRDYISFRFKAKQIKQKFKYPKIIFKQVYRNEFVWYGLFPKSNDLVILIYDDNVADSCILHILEKQWALRSIIITDDVLLDSFL